MLPDENIEPTFQFGAGYSPFIRRALQFLIAITETQGIT